MRRSTVVLLMLLVVTTSAFAARDPDYDRILDTFKTKRWKDFDGRAPKFVKEKPDYQHTHYVRYMIAESYWLRNRSGDAIAAYEDYIRHHDGAKYSVRSRQRILQVLCTEKRYEEALARADAFLADLPKDGARDGIAYERATALEELRRFAEAVTAYRAVAGTYREKSHYRAGVAQFRGRQFKESATTLREFLRKWPSSAWERSARDYLFRADAPYRTIKRGVVVEYRGKYEDDPRLEAIRKRLPELRASSFAHIEKAVGIAPPKTALIRLADAGSNRSGNFASTRVEVVMGKPRQVLVLYTEYLVTGSFDLPSTLTHELYHARQRDSLGEAHFTTPKWVREGAAVFVAGQGEARTRMLAAETGRRTNVSDPMARLVNGLGGRHGFDDYAEDVAAFESVAARHGPEKLRAFLRRLLETPDFERAIKEVLGEDFATFEGHAKEHARRVLEPLLKEGRSEVLTASRHLGAGRPDEALSSLPKTPGIYLPAVVYMKALAHLNANRPKQALAVIRDEYYPNHRTFTPLTDNATLLEVKALRALAHPDFAKVADRARIDLEPTGAYRALLKLID